MGKSSYGMCSSPRVTTILEEEEESTPVRSLCSY